MPFDSFNDLKVFVLDRADEVTTGSSKFDALVSDLCDEVQRELITLHPWIGLQVVPPQAQVIAAALTNLTITVAAGATAAVLSAAPGRDVTGWWVIVGGNSYYFRVKTHAAPSSPNLTLDAPAPETLTAHALTLAQIEFDLIAGTGVLANQIWSDGGGGLSSAPIRVIGDEEIRYWYSGTPALGWAPEYAARVGLTRVRLSHYDTRAHRIEIPYYLEPATPSGATALTLPAWLRPALAEGTLAHLYELKGDSRVAASEARFARKVSKAKDYDFLLRAGLGALGGERRNAPYR